MTHHAAGATPPPEHRKDRRRRAWAMWRWYDRFSGWHDWVAWIKSFFATKAGMTVALGSVAAVTTAAAIVAHDIDRRYAAPPPEPVAIEPVRENVRQTASTLIFAIEGRDKAGRAGTFDVVVARKNFLWVRGSSDELEKDGTVIARAKVAPAVMDADVRAALGDAREVVAVGAASQEGDPAEELQRAKRRAQRTAEIVREAIPEGTPISTLNLGQYREPCPTCDRATGTNWQRPFMLIAVKQLEPDTVLAEALADAMSGKTKLPSPASYSAFDMGRFR